MNKFLSFLTRKKAILNPNEKVEVNIADIHYRVEWYSLRMNYSYASPDKQCTFFINKSEAETFAEVLREAIKLLKDDRHAVRVIEEKN